MIKNKLLLILLFSICSILPPVLLGQVDTAWVRRFYGNAGGDDMAYAIGIDNSGNVYVTGSCWDSVTGDNIATVKYNINGVQQWVQRYHSPGGGNDRAHAMVVDNQSNVFVTGYGYGPYSEDYVTIKYNTVGQEQWVMRYGYPGYQGSDEAKAIALDNQGDVYVTGLSWGGITGYDYATIKYSSSGQEVWVARYTSEGNADDFAYAIAVDNLYNVYVTGTSYSSTTDYDFVTVKYNASGQEQWVRRYTQSGFFDDRAYAIKVDNEGNIIVSGGAYSAMPALKDFFTIKYNSNGDTIWTRRYRSTTGTGTAYALAIDSLNNIYVTGTSMGLYSPDYLTVKYDANGQEMWVARYNGPIYASIDEAQAISLDNSNNVYITGKSGGTNSYDDYATVKYNASGVQQWVMRYDGPINGVDQANAIAVDNANNIYVTGRSRGVDISYDFATIKYVQTQGVKEIALHTLAKTGSVKLYPNPAKTYFTIHLSQNADHIIIYDVSGKVVKEIRDCQSCLRQQRNDNIAIVPLIGIKNGIYFVKVKDEMVKEKLVVTK